MTPQELKNSILQLAIQGRLVEQRPEEGTAEELYQQIQREKAALVKAGKIKKEKPLPEITEEEVPFEIPEGWKWVRLNSITFNHGHIVPAEEFSYIDIGSIDNRNQRLSAEENIIAAEKAPSRARRIVVHGDILYSTVRPYLHNMCIVDREFSRQPIASTGFAVMSCPSGINNRYLFYYLMSPAFDSYANNTENAKGVAYPAINDDRLYRAVIAIPPLAEQKRIVAKIEELLPYIDRYEKAWNRLEDFNRCFPLDLQKSILQLAIQGKLLPQRPEEGTAEALYQQIQNEKSELAKIGEVYREKDISPIGGDDLPYDIPVSWIWCRLGTLTKVITKGSSPAWQGVSYTDEGNGILFVTSENVGNNEMLLSKRKYVERIFNEMHSASILKKGDILTNLVGASIGRTAVFEEIVPDANINQAVCIIRLVNKSISDYILKYFMSVTAIRLMLSDTVETARANLSLTSITNLLIPLPPLAEQKRIVAKLEELLLLCEKLK